MFSKLREVLLTQYIGAFLIALMLWQAAVEIVTRIVHIGYWLPRMHAPSVLSDHSLDPFRWDGLVLTIVSVTIYVAAGYSLARWLYPLQVPAATSKSEMLPGEAREES